MANQLLSFSPAFLRQRATAPQEAWPPVSSPAVYFDFDLGEGYWGGSAKTTLDLIDDGSGAYRIDVGDLGLSGTEDYTMLVEFYNDAAALDATSATDLLGWRVASPSNNFSIIQRSATQALGVNLYPRISQNTPLGTKDTFVWNLGSGSTDLAVTEGIQRLVVSRENGADTVAANSMAGFSNVNVTNTNTSYPASGYYLYINQSPSTYGNAAGTPNTTGTPIRRIAIWDRVLTPAELFKASRYDRPGILLLGDSFQNNGETRRRLQNELEGRGLGPVAIAYNGVGSQGLDSHATRYAALDSVYYDEYLLIDEGGWDNDVTTSKAAIDSILSNITHDQWAIVEPNPLNAIGTTERDAWNDMFYGASDNAGAREIYNYVGGDAHYIKTYDTMLANGDGGATDLARIADGLWPLNVAGDGTHPNVLGQQLRAGLIADYAVARKWI